MLRSYRSGDGPWYYDVALRNKEHLGRYESGNAIMSIFTQKDAEVTVRQFAADWAARNAFFLAALLKDSGAFVAQVYIGPNRWDPPDFEIGYFADAAHVGQGYVSEAVRGALHLVFEHLQAHRASLNCDDTNVRSARVAERCGFVLEGHIRENHRMGEHPISSDLCYGLLQREYLAIVRQRMDSDNAESSTLNQEKEVNDHRQNAKPQ